MKRTHGARRADRRKQLNVAVDRELYEAVAAEARAEERRVSNMGLVLIREALAARGLQRLAAERAAR